MTMIGVGVVFNNANSPHNASNLFNLNDMLIDSLKEPNNIQDLKAYLGVTVKLSSCINPPSCVP